GFAYGKTLVRRKSAAGQKAGWVAFIVTGQKLKISILTVPSKKERHAESVSFFFGFAGRCPLHPSVFLLFQRCPALLGGILHRRRGFLFSWRKTPNPLSLLPEVGQAQVG